ncbi:MAG: nucleoside triphosphate pyrophosphohydrolase [Caulobacteraceae bacterium]|jgi:MazG family protein|nr:nucleoside triphosphate pyrophosphohydrolase [Caulobacteraceae bacterium]
MTPAPAADAEPASREPPIAELLKIMARLRDPAGGCAWDLEQTFATIAPYTVEEAYEVADAIRRGAMGDLAEELGDLLLQVVFHAQMAREAGAFDFNDVVRGISAKMIRRHPHVFGDAEVRTAAEQTAAWEEIKAAERARKAQSGAKPAAGLLDDIAVTLPALTRASKLSRRAARVGFVWPHIEAILAKLREEVAELEAEVAAGDTAKAREELGDVLFVCANIARELDVDPEDALRETNAKFTRRFGYIERALAERGSSPEQSNLAEMDALWDEAKHAERPEEKV